MPGKPVLLAEGYLGFATVLPGLYMSPPLLPELRTPLGVFILCSFHAAQYVSSTGCIPGGVKLTLTNIPPRSVWKVKGRSSLSGSLKAEYTLLLEHDKITF